MNVFEAVKQSVTTRQAAEHYGIRVFPKPALKHGSMMALLNAILLFDILNISSEICYSLAGMRNPG